LIVRGAVVSVRGTRVGFALKGVIEKSGLFERTKDIIVEYFGILSKDRPYNFPLHISHFNCNSGSSLDSLSLSLSLYYNNNNNNNNNVKYIKANEGTNNMGAINSSHRIAATLYSLETWFVSGIYV
jgi:hypothetical protein